MFHTEETDAYFEQCASSTQPELGFGDCHSQMKNDIAVFTLFNEVVIFSE
jgi:hypothetical protein